MSSPSRTEVGRRQDRSGTYRLVQAARFFAAWLVVLTHSTLYAHDRLSSGLGIWRLGGTLGVEIFFGISGFVMVISSRNLLGLADGWKYFALRRIVRIVPLYWLATTFKLFVMVAAGGLVLHATLDPGHVLASYFFVPMHNADGAVEPLLGVGWTLIYEMFFYLVFTLVLMFRMRPVTGCGVILFSCAAATVLRPDDWPAVLVYLSPIVLNFFVGMALGEWISTSNTRLLALRIAATLLLWAAIPMVEADSFSAFEWSTMLRHLSVVAVLVAAVALEGRVGWMVPRALSRLGDSSYSLYLFHPLLAPAIPAVLARLGLISVPLSIGLTLVILPWVGLMIYRMIELPTTRFLMGRLPYTLPRRPVG